MSYCDNSEGGMWNNKWGEESFVLFLIGQNLHWISLSVISIYKTGWRYFPVFGTIKEWRTRGTEFITIS